MYYIINSLIIVQFLVRADNCNKPTNGLHNIDNIVIIVRLLGEVGAIVDDRQAFPIPAAGYYYYHHYCYHYYYTGKFGERREAVKFSLGDNIITYTYKKITSYPLARAAPQVCATRAR